ncbi:MAG: NAD(P)H-hydrate dehydratase [Treponema sp.]|nr:NAD(P)H-hydrate dehydratase [Candidatus Treponema equifaecale]
MQKLYTDTRKIDSSCRAAYGLTEEIMMENAAMALEKVVRNPYPISGERRAPQKIVIACGGGNNGADGYTLARRLRFDYDVAVIQFTEPESELCKLQADRAEKCGVRFVKRDDLSFYDLRYTDIIVDCVYGSGFHDDFDEKIFITMNDMNTCDCFKIACDVPSGLRENGTVAEGAFVADVTVTMGALKTCLYSDCAKDYVGEVICGELGVNRRLYENSSNGNLSVGMLLEESDLYLPHRDRCNVNKGSFGHVVVVSGEKAGAAVLAGSAALRFGAGLVTVVHKSSKKNFEVPPELMSATEIPENIKAIAFGMGLGKETAKIQPYFDWVVEHSDSKCVVDADALCSENLRDFIEKKEKGVVLTPHPKEFQTMLKNCDLGEYTVPEIVENRMELVEKFCRKFPKKTLVLKGANPVIGYFDGYKYKMFINPFGRPCLAKAGSGDVLSGLIVALLAQKRKSIEAAMGGSLAHALASRKIKCDYAMTPMDLINAVTEL